MDRLNLRFVAVGRAFTVVVYHHWSPERSMQVSPPVPPCTAEYYQWHSQVTDDTWALHVFVLFLFFFGWGGEAEGMLP